MRQLIYTARESSWLSNKDAQVYGPELYRLSEQHERLTPEIIVNAASAKRSVLHTYFDWDDSEAAIKWRKSQARKLVRSIKIVIEDSPEEEEIQLFYNVENGRGQKYVTVFTILKDAEYRQQLIEQALNEIKRWEIKYKQLNELRQIFQAVEQVQKKLAV